MASSPTRLAVDPERAITCVSLKLSLPTREAALEHAEQMMLRGKVHPGCHITPYECADCGQWHVYNRIIVKVGRGQTHVWGDHAGT